MANKSFIKQIDWTNSGEIHKIDPKYIVGKKADQIVDGSMPICVNGEIKAQEGYGYKETVQTTTLTWDGTIAGKTFVMIEDAILCRLTDWFPDDPSTLVGQPAKYIIEGSQETTGVIAYMDDMREEMHFVLYLAGPEVEEPEEPMIYAVDQEIEMEGVTLTRGLWFVKFDGVESYISSLTLPQPVPFTTTHTISKELLPLSELATDKLSKSNPTGTGSLSLNRKEGTEIGKYSVATGEDNTASGRASHAEGQANTASGSSSHAEGSNTTASGSSSHAEGTGTIAAKYSQHVFGTYNIEDTDPNWNGRYVEIVGNGGNSSNRSNARTLSWTGDETIAGNLKAAGLTDGTITKTMTEILSGGSGVTSIGGATGAITLGTGLSISGQTLSGPDTSTLMTKSSPTGTGVLSMNNNAFSVAADGTINSTSGIDLYNSDLYTVNGPDNVILKTYQDQLVLNKDTSSAPAEFYGELGLKLWSSANVNIISSYGSITLTPGEDPGSKVIVAGTFKADSLTDNVGNTKTMSEVLAAATPYTAGTNIVINDHLISAPSVLTKADPTGTGSLSLNRKSGTTIGSYSAALGHNCTASNTYSVASGYQTVGSGLASHAEGVQSTASYEGAHAEGTNTTASEEDAHAEGYATTASGRYSHAEGNTTIANHKSQHVFGEYNSIDSSSGGPRDRGNYVEIVGNGTFEGRSNARTLDWSGNETISGNLNAAGLTDGTTTKTMSEILAGGSSYTAGSNIDITDNVISATGLLTTTNPTGTGSLSLNRKASTTIGYNSVATGTNSTASEHSAFASGYNTRATGGYSSAFGSETWAAGVASHAEGYQSKASNQNAHAEGYSTTASGADSHAEGDRAAASAYAAHAEGYATTASGFASHAEGDHTTANHRSQHTFGEYNIIDDSSAEFDARGNYVEIVGNGTYSAKSNARTLDWSGNETIAGNLQAAGLTDGTTTKSMTEILAGGGGSYTAGTNIDITNNVISAPNVLTSTDPTGTGSFNFNRKPSTTVGTGSVAVGGYQVTASGTYSYAEGYDTTAIGSYSHAEGWGSNAQGQFAHAEGDRTYADKGSHSEGSQTRAEGEYSHAEGYYTETTGKYAHAEGYNTKAYSNYQHVQGKYNVVDDSNTYAFIIGNGSDDFHLSNAMTVDWTGNIKAAGLTDGTTTKTMTEILAGGGGSYTAGTNIDITNNVISAPNVLATNNPTFTGTMTSTGSFTDGTITKTMTQMVEGVHPMVTTISSASTNTDCVSAKAVYDYIQSLDISEVEY